MSSESYVPSLFRSPSSSPKLIYCDLYRLCVGVRVVFYRLWTRDEPLCSLGSCIHYCFMKLTKMDNLATEQYSTQNVAAIEKALDQH